MKRLLLFALLLVAARVVSAQHHITLHLAQRLGNGPFAFDVPVSAGTYDYKITRLDYYLSGFSVIHDGGQLTSLPNVILLVHPAQDSIYDLGDYPDIMNIEAMAFHIGVDPDHNHTDPSTYPADHPLSPQNPEMHWGWTAGYRFIAFEGVVGSNFAKDFGIHVLGDENYKTVKFATTAQPTPDGQAIHLHADYANLLTGLDVENGLIVHGSTDEAVTLMDNMISLVFSNEVTATVGPAFAGSFSLSPNPTTAGVATVRMTLPAGTDYRLVLTDLLGRVLLDQALTPENQSFTFKNELAPGLYFAHLLQDGHPVAVQKWSIIK